jgi:hypothetical protein
MNTYEINLFGVGTKTLKGNSPKDAATRHGYNPNLINTWEDVSIVQGCDQVMREGLGHEGEQEVRKALQKVFPKVHRGTKFILPMILMLLVNISFSQSILREPIYGISNVHGFKADTEVGLLIPIATDTDGRYRHVFFPQTLEVLWTAYSFIPDELNTLVRFRYLVCRSTREEFIAYNFDDDSHWSLRRVLSYRHGTELALFEEAGQWTEFDWTYDSVKKTLSLGADGRTVWTAKIDKITSTW